MSNTIDKRVVEMGFDNKQFESGVKTSLNTVDTLKKGLKFNESYGSGLSGLANLLHGLPIGGISEGVQNISSKFSILGAIGFAAIQNITNSVINLAKKLWDTVSPIEAAKRGLSEYETQINAIQTILANTSQKGTTMLQVNEALDQLNTYADKTIYNFSEMTKNIGTFTAAGIDLDTSVAAIKGIANLAAVSGSTSQQASTAMYQLSQALSSGTVKLMDWNSVVNAGMGGQIFKDALMETARAHGVAVDQIIKDEGSFRESLSKGWITSSILTETLSKFTGDLNAEQLKTMGYTEDQIVQILKLGQTANDAATKVKTFSQLKETLNEAIGSGWAQSWRIIVGDFEEAKSLFTNISDSLGGLISESSNARNSLLQTWKDVGARTAIIQVLQAAFEMLVNVLKPIKEAWAEIFPPATVAAMSHISILISEFARKLVLSSDTISKVKTIFKGLFSVFDIVRMAIVAVIKGFSRFGDVGKIAGSGLLDLLVRFSNFIINLREGIKLNDIFTKAIDKFIGYIQLAGVEITNFVNVLKEKFGLIKPYVDTVVGYFATFFNNLKAKFQIIRDWLPGLFNNIDTGGVDSFFEKIGARFEPLKTLGKLMVTVIGGIIKILAKLAPTFFKIASKIGSAVYEFAKMIGEGIANLDFSKLFDAINSGLLIALILGIKQFVTKGGKALDSVGDVFGGLKGMLSGVTGILDGVRGSLQAWQENLKAKTLLTIAAAIAILAASLLVISLIDSEKLTTSILAITALFANLTASMAIFSATGGAGLKATVSLVGMAIALLILSAAVTKLSKINREDLKKGLAAISDLTFVLIGFSYIMSKNSGDIIKSSAGLILFAVALNLLVGAVERLGEMDPVKLTNGLIAVGTLMAELGIFTRLADLDKGGVSKGLGLLAMTAAILVLSSIVEKFGNMDVGALQQGLTAIGFLMSELALFTRLTGDGKNIIATSIGIVILAGAMVIFTDVITKLGNLSWEQIGKGLLTMGLALLIIFAAVKLMPKDAILTGLALVVIASSLVILSEALTTMGNMSWEQITKGLVTLGIALAILGVAMQVMQSSVGGALALLIISGALAIFVPTLQSLGSMSIEEIAIGLGALAAMFVILGIAGAILTPVIPTLLGLGIAIALLGIAIGAIGLGVLAFSTGLAALAVSGTAGVAAIVLMITMLIGLIPMIVSALVNAIVLFVKLIGDAVPIIAEAFKKILLGILDVIREVAPVLIITILELLISLIELINTVTPPFIDAVFNLIGELLDTIAEKVPDFVQSGMDILLGFLKGIRDNIYEIVTVAIDIVTEFIDAVADKIPDIIDSGWNLIISFIDGLAQGIDDNMPELQAAIGRLATAIVEGLANGLSSGVGSVAKAIGKLAGGAIDALKTLLGIFSPSKVFTKLGEMTSLGFVNGLLNLAKSVYNAATDIGNKAIDGITSAVASIRDSLSDNIEFAPTIRPVVDLTDVISGGKQIDSLLRNKTLSVSGVANNISSISNGLLSKNITQEQPNKIVPQGASISYTQINNSPVALSRIEIYRQTRNQLLTLKGALRSTGS